MYYQVIIENQALQRVCAEAEACRYIALDTEFIRTRTYYPQLGLLQLYDGQQVSLIDPLTITDWAPFNALLQNEKVTKLLHAGSEDLEVFLNVFGTLPKPLLDSQILAAFCGHAISCGFATLVMEYQQIELDKSEARTDWLARPLTEKQLSYAAADVYYLLPLAKELLQRCEELGWLSAAINESELLAQRKQKRVDPDAAYLDITDAWQLRTRQLGCLKLLAAWRLTTAKNRDLALNFVIREESLWKVARYQPTSLAELSNLGLTGQEIRYHGKSLLTLVEKAKQLTEEQLPSEIVRLIDRPNYKKIFKQVKSLVQQISEQTALSSELLASRRQINQLIQWHWANSKQETLPELLTGWRGELFAGTLQNILAEQ